MRAGSRPRFVRSFKSCLTLSLGWIGSAFPLVVADSGRCEPIDPLPPAAGTPLLGTFTYPGDSRRIQLTNFCYGTGNLMLVGGA